MPVDRDPCGVRSARARVSVIIPCRDCERYVGEAIASVLAQTWRQREVIVVDDGSRDHSGEIVRRFGAAVRIHRQPPAGPGAARNAGVGLAHGAFLAFLDADDLWPEDSLANRMASLASAPELDVVVGHARQFISPDASAEVSQRVHCPVESVTVRVPGTMLMRRAAFDRVGSFSTDVVVGEGLDWWLRADELGLRSAAVADVVLLRRLHSANLGLVERGRRCDYLRVVRAALERRRGHQPPVPGRQG